MCQFDQPEIRTQTSRTDSIVLTELAGRYHGQNSTVAKSEDSAPIQGELEKKQVSIFFRSN